MLLPTTFLPKIKTLSSQPLRNLEEHISTLRQIYTPPVRGSGLRATADAELEVLQNDTFERAYSIKWLTAVVALSQKESSDDVMIREDVSYDQNLETVLSDAASLLSLCSGAAAAPVFSRTFTFTLDDNQHIKVILKDTPLLSQDFSGVGSQTWGSSCLLADLMTTDPTAFGLTAKRTNMKVLELGAGTGLLSIVVAKLFFALGFTHSKVVATDFHPQVLENLQSNVAINFPEPDMESSLTVRPLDWSDFATERPPEFPQMDLILGGDIIYESKHAEWVKLCVGSLLRKPIQSELQPGCKSFPMFHLIIPLRETHHKESETVERTFGHVGEPQGLSNEEFSREKLSLGILAVTEMVRQAYVDVVNGAAKDVAYRYFKIGWGLSAVF